MIIFFTAAALIALLSSGCEVEPELGKFLNPPVLLLSREHLRGNVYHGINVRWVSTSKSPHGLTQQTETTTYKC